MGEANTIQMSGWFFERKKNIMWEPIILGNLQQNGSAKWLGQTLLQKASGMLKKAT